MGAWSGLVVGATGAGKWAGHHQAALKALPAGETLGTTLTLPSPSGANRDSCREGKEAFRVPGCMGPPVCPGCRTPLVDMGWGLGGGVRGARLWVTVPPREGPASCVS